MLGRKSWTGTGLTVQSVLVQNHSGKEMMLSERTDDAEMVSRTKLPLSSSPDSLNSQFEANSEYM